MENKYGNLLTIILIVAIVAIVGVLGFFGYKMISNSQTDKKARDVATDFNTAVDNKGNNNENNNTSSGEGESSLEDILNTIGNNDNSSSIYGQSGTKEITYQGYKVIGTISIPSINIEYPILAENNQETLKLSIVAAYPQNPASAVNQPGNLVLWGHNYKNGTFFSDINKLTTGAKIYIKDLTGTKVEYQVYNVYETTDSDMKYATRNTDGAKEITLSTCTNDPGNRTIVWARETK